MRRCVAEHRALAEAAGAQALLRGGGWIKAFRTSRGEDLALKDIEETKPFGVPAVALNRDQLLALEPHSRRCRQGRRPLHRPAHDVRPQALTQAYARLLVARGGRFVAGDALQSQAVGRWLALTTADGPLHAADAVAALGPWSKELAAAFGYSFRSASSAATTCTTPPRAAPRSAGRCSIVERGYILAPMARGLRLTTGAEFARRDDPPSSAHLDRIEPSCRELFPLGERLDPAPWLGSRPALPDMAPVIGPAPRHKGLWFDFGHQHLGLTLGPVSGLLLAQLVSGETPFVDPAPFRADRF